MKRTAIITGASGGIGQGLCKVFKENDYEIIGIDLPESRKIANIDTSLFFDLAKLTSDENYRLSCLSELDSSVGDSLHVLINNAAVQLLNKTENISVSEWNETLSVNLTAPMILSKWAVPYLSKNSGSIINIASIHHKLTKKGFVSYASSKSALVGMTRAMAVDLNGDVRVNCISPAAIETEMLKAGFENAEKALDELRKIHPTQDIGTPEQVAKLALFLASNEAKFINGSNIELDGGIGSVLHDL